MPTSQQNRKEKRMKDCDNCEMYMECDLQNIPEFTGDEICERLANNEFVYMADLMMRKKPNKE